MDNFSATPQQMAQALNVLFSSMQFRTGTDPEGSLKGYVLALNGMQVRDIVGAVELVMRGEAKGVSKTFVPSPAEFRAVVLQYILSTQKVAEKVSKPQYRLTHPRSKVLANNITRDQAKQRVEDGRSPRGSIWIPGPLSENAAYGTLYGPDPKWSFDKRNIHVTDDTPPVPDTPESRARMLLKMAILQKAQHMNAKAVDRVAAAQKSGRFDEFIAIAQEWKIPVSEDQWAQKDHMWA